MMAAARLEVVMVCFESAIDGCGVLYHTAFIISMILLVVSKFKPLLQRTCFSERVV
jgi:hypothetical protein